MEKRERALPRLPVEIWVRIFKHIQSSFITERDHKVTFASSRRCQKWLFADAILTSCILNNCLWTMPGEVTLYIPACQLNRLPAAPPKESGLSMVVLYSGAAKGNEWGLEMISKPVTQWLKRLGPGRLEVRFVSPDVHRVEPTMIESLIGLNCRTRVDFGTPDDLFLSRKFATHTEHDHICLGGAIKRARDLAKKLGTAVERQKGSGVKHDSKLKLHGFRRMRCICEKQRGIPLDTLVNTILPPLLDHCVDKGGVYMPVDFDWPESYAHWRPVTTFW
ncbi:hypothetical protein PV08_12108 [Exophiala spinifera]|uniref:Uncharacterized protein n=1 Tax=Exophiala spinifera TaxID=91928 RepID=A0A0D1Y3X9_9EURO|nr:uncharacterized protein PV08_12108 [Exophiala spinifera]KIW09641.1 hypothetical protein PV08_12108 [Exophiala spinifera]